MAREVSLVALVLQVYVLVLCNAAAPSTLRQVNILYRHGDRSPTNLYPTDPNQVDAWPDGLGQLSQIGMRQQYNLGRFFRERFNGFINDTYYRHSEIAIRSTDVDRTLMSAYSDLSGLFPPHGYQIWNEKIPNWQPVPVHTYNKSTDTLLRWDVKCKKVDELMAETWSSDEVLDQEKADKDFFSGLEKDMGVDYTVGISTMWKVADPFVAEKAHNMTWAPFMNDEKYAKVKHYHGLGFYYMFDTEMKQRLRSGTLVEQLKKNMERIVKGESSSKVPKIFMYSAHDTTVAGLLSALRVFDKLAPPFASSVFLELHEVSQGQFEVRIFYKNNTVTDPKGSPITISMPGCNKNSKSCTFQEFVNSTKHLYSVNYAVECDNVSVLNSLTRGQLVAISVVVTAVVALIIGICCFFVFRRRTKAQYANVNTSAA